MSYVIVFVLGIATGLAGPMVWQKWADKLKSKISD